MLLASPPSAIFVIMACMPGAETVDRVRDE